MMWLRYWTGRALEWVRQHGPHHHRTKFGTWPYCARCGKDTR